MIDDIYYCAVKNEWEYDFFIEQNGRENVKFGALHHCFRNTEDEFIFSRAVAKFQNLILT